MGLKNIRVLLFFGLILLLSHCTRVNQPIAIEPLQSDSCLNIPQTVQTGKLNLDKPVFTINPDSLPYATKVFLVPDSVANPAVFEISVDSGKVWVPAKCITLVNSGEIWARKRYNEATSPIAKAAYTIYYERVVVVGNSITGHGPAPELGWYGDWGMAASSIEKDYLHIITKKLKKLNPKVEIKVIFAVDFEQTYWQYDLNKLQQYADFKPDLVVMRIAENTDLSNINSYEGIYANYVGKLTSKTNAKVICTTSFWSNYGEVTAKIRSVAFNRGYILADFTPLWADKSYAAFSFFENTGVGAHPSDKGMQAIADRISIYF